MDKYLYLGMLKFLLIALVLTAVLVSAEPDRTMCHFKVSLEYPDDEPGTHKWFDKEIWFGKGGHFRLLEEADLVLQVQQLLIWYPGTLYQANLLSGQGTVIHNNSELEYMENAESYGRSWPNSPFLADFGKYASSELLASLMPLVFPEREDALGRFKIGFENNFFNVPGSKELRSKRIGKTTCDVWQIKRDNYEWTLYAGRFSKLPKLIVFKSDDYHYRLTYDVYECGLPFDSTLFIPPDDITFTDITDSVMQLMDSIKSTP